MRRRISKSKFLKIIGITIICFGLFKGCDWFSFGGSSEVDDPANLIVNYEYDHQTSWYTFPNGTTRLNNAFNACQTTLNKKDDDLSLPDSTIPGSGINSYINLHYDRLANMYYLSIYNEFPRRPGIDDDAVAISTPGPQQYSCVFLGYVYNTFGNSPYNWDQATIQKAEDFIVIHEFGHQRANLGHHDVEIENCAMVNGVARGDFSFIDNSFGYCGAHRKNVSDVQWTFK